MKILKFKFLSGFKFYLKKISNQINSYYFYLVFFTAFFFTAIFFFCYSYEYFLIFFRSFFNLLKKLYDGDLLCEILGLIDDDSFYKANAFYNKYMFFPNYIRYVKNYEHFYLDTTYNDKRIFGRYKPYRPTGFYRHMSPATHSLSGGPTTGYTYTVWSTGNDTLNELDNLLCKLIPGKYIVLKLNGRSYRPLFFKGQFETHYNLLANPHKRFKPPEDSMPQYLEFLFRYVHFPWTYVNNYDNKNNLKKNFYQKPINHLSFIDMYFKKLDHSLGVHNLFVGDFSQTKSQQDQLNFVTGRESFYKYLNINKKTFKKRSYFRRGWVHNWPAPDFFYFPHYNHILSGGSWIYKYLYFKAKNYFPQNWHANAGLLLNDYLDTDVNNNTKFDKLLPFLNKLPRIKSVDIPNRYPVLELYKFYALDEDMFKVIHNYYREIIRPYNLKYVFHHFDDLLNYQYNHYFQNTKFIKLFDNLKNICNNTNNYDFNSFDDEFFFYEDIYTHQFTNKTFSDSIKRRGYCYLLQEAILKKIFVSYRRDFRLRYRWAMSYKDWYFSKWYDQYTKRNIRTFTRRRALFIYKYYYVYKFTIPYSAGNTLYFFKYDNRFLNLYQDVFNLKFMSSLLWDLPVDHSRKSIILEGWPKSRSMLLYYAVRDFIKLADTKEKDFYEIDPTIIGISGLIELSLTLKRLRKAILKNDNYFYKLESHFHEYQLKWMWACNDLINEKLKSNAKDSEDALSYFRKKRKKVAITHSYSGQFKRAMTINKFVFNNSIYTNFRFCTRTRLYKHAIMDDWYKRRKLRVRSHMERIKRRFGTKRRIWVPVHMRKRWRAIIDYDRASANLFTFLENPKKQINRHAFITAIENYYYSLKAFIRICWKKKMGRDQVKMFVWPTDSKDFRFYYNGTRVPHTRFRFFTVKSLTKAGRVRVQKFKLVKSNIRSFTYYNTTVNQTLITHAPVQSPFYKPLYLNAKCHLSTHHTDEQKGGLVGYELQPWRFTKQMGRLPRYTKIRLQLNKFYKQLNQILASRSYDEPFYGLGMQHLFTRIARELILIEIPKYKKSDYRFTSLSFRYLSFRQNYKWIITKYLNYFTDEEIEKVWSEFDIEIINGHFNLQRMNFFLNFLRELFFNKLNNYLWKRRNARIDDPKFILKSDAEIFALIWKYYKIIFYDTLFINQLYDSQWESVMHSDKEVVVYQIKKHLGNMQNNFIKFFIGNDFLDLHLTGLWTKKQGFKNKRYKPYDIIKYLGYTNTLFIDMNKYSFNCYLDYFISLLNKYSDTEYTKKYKYLFRTLAYANKRYVKENYELNLDVIFESRKKSIEHKKYKNESFSVFRRVYQTYYKALAYINDE